MNIAGYGARDSVRTLAGAESRRHDVGHPFNRNVTGASAQPLCRLCKPVPGATSVRAPACQGSCSGSVVGIIRRRAKSGSQHLKFSTLLANLLGTFEKIRIGRDRIIEILLICKHL